MCTAFVPSFPTQTCNAYTTESSATPISAKRVVHVARNGLERAKLIAHSVSRESVGSAEKNPFSAGLNLTCDLGELVLHGIPTHAHWHQVCASILHIVSDILTATPN